MAININAKTTGVGGLETSADNSGNINIQSGGSTVMSVTSSGVTVTGSFSQNGAVYSTQPSFRNLIINGDMKIDQRNAGASVTPTSDDTYTLDRWAAGINIASKFSVQQNAGSVTPPSGFTNYLGITSLSAYSVSAGDVAVLKQTIEGLNIAHLNWGTANAKTVTLSFWVRSSLTGTFGGTMMNSVQNRAYPFTYTISSANTWEKKSVTIAGDTTGTWLTTNGAGIKLGFQLGVGSTFTGTAGSWSGNNYWGATGATSVVGTSGATFYITGVQLEVGSTATEFEHLPYDVELARCQRYYQTYTQPPLRGTINSTSTLGRAAMILPVPMRASPNATSGALPVFDGSNVSTVSSINASYNTAYKVEFDMNLSSAVMVVGRAGVVYQSGSATLTLSAEL